MPKGVLAVNINGELTYCTAPEDKRGIGRCNHVFHKLENENDNEFLERMTKYQFVSLKDEQMVNSVIGASVIGGTQKKWWSEDGKILYKQDLNEPSKGMVQWNGLAEDISSKFLNTIGIDCAECQTVIVNGKVGVLSKNFLKEGESLVEFSEILNNEDMEFLTNIENDDFNQKMDYLVNKLESKTGKNFKDDIIKLMRTDIILMSADRHYGNMALIYDKNGNYRFSTIYDNGQCLLAENGYKNIEAFGDDKLFMPGLNIFGMFPMEDYARYVKKNSNNQNMINIDLNQVEKFCENYSNVYYDSEKVEKTKWLLYDNVDYWTELGILEEG